MVLADVQETVQWDIYEASYQLHSSRLHVRLT